MTILTFFALTAGRCCWPRRVFLETGKGDEYGGIDGSGYALHSRLPHILWLAGPPAA